MATFQRAGLVNEMAVAAITNTSRSRHRGHRHRQELHRLGPHPPGAWRRGDRAYSRRASGLFDDVRVARADGTYGRLLGTLARMDVLLLLEDWGLGLVRQ